MQLFDFISNIANGKLTDFDYTRQAMAKWDVTDESYLLLSNLNIIDVHNGRIMPERAILIKDKKLES